MLFVFSKPGVYKFWMPDMYFAIDIVWIADGKIAAIHKRAPPMLDMQNPIFYSPPKPVQYVLELNGGFAEKHNIEAGDSVTIGF